MHGQASSQYSNLPVLRIQGLNVEPVVTDTTLAICFSMVKKLRRSDSQYQHGRPLAMKHTDPLGIYSGALHCHEKRVAQLCAGSGS